MRARFVVDLRVDDMVQVVVGGNDANELTLAGENVKYQALTQRSGPSIMKYVTRT